MKKHSLGISFLFTASLFGFLFGVLSMHAYFMTDDDVFTILVTKGIGLALKPYENIYWMNILYGSILKHMYLWQPHIPWHGLFLLTSCYLGTWAFLAALYYRNRPVLSSYLFAVCFFLIDTRFILTLEFTASSFFVFQGGLFLLLANHKEKPTDGAGGILVFFCFLSSYILRPMMFELGCLAVLPLVIHEFFLKKSRSLPVTSKVALTTAFITILACSTHDSQYYAKHPAWNEFQSFNSAIGELISFRFLKYDEQKKTLFDSIHWSRNDVDLFDNWCFLDKSRFSIKNFESITNSFPTFDWKKQNPIEPLDQIMTDPTDHLIYLACLCLSLFVLKEWLILSIMTFFIFLIYVLLFFLMKSPPWIFEPLLAFIPHTMIYLASSPSTSPALTKTQKLAVISLFTFAMIFFSNQYKVNQYKRDLEPYVDSCLQKLSDTPDQLYVIWHNTLPYENLNALGDFEIFRKINIFGMHEFERTPVGEDMLKHFQIKDLFTDIVDRPDIFMICNPDEGCFYIRGMEEHYHRTVRPHRIFGCAFFNVYRFTDLGKK